MQPRCGAGGIGSRLRTRRRGGANPVAEARQLALDPLAAQPGPPVPSPRSAPRSGRQRMAVLPCEDRPAVGGPTAGASAAALPASPAGPSAAAPGAAGPGPSTARSAQPVPGFGFCRRSTATSWRSTSNSASFESAERAGSTIQPAIRTKIRQAPYRHEPAMLPASQRITAGESAGQPPMPHFGTPHALCSPSSVRGSLRPGQPKGNSFVTGYLAGI